MDWSTLSLPQEGGWVRPFCNRVVCQLSTLHGEGQQLKIRPRGLEATLELFSLGEKYSREVGSTRVSLGDDKSFLLLRSNTVLKLPLNVNIVVNVCHLFEVRTNAASMQLMAALILAVLWDDIYSSISQSNEFVKAFLFNLTNKF